MTEKFRFQTLWVILGWLGVMTVFVGSLTPLEHVPKVPGSDKAHHFAAYGSLMFWFGQIYLRRRFSVAVALVAMGVLIEVLQPRISNRFFEFEDVIANNLGVGLGFLVLLSPLRSSLAWLDARLAR